jgi:uncharacterized membrane protein
MKILLFNDNPVVRKLVALSAQKTKDDLSVIWSVDEIEESGYDLLIIDDALYSDEMFESLKEHITFKSTLLMATRGKAIPAGFDNIINKPFLPTDLVDMFIQIEKKFLDSPSVPEVVFAETPVEEEPVYAINLEETLPDLESDELNTFDSFDLEGLDDLSEGLDMDENLDRVNFEDTIPETAILDKEEVQEVQGLLEDTENDDWDLDNGIELSGIEEIDLSEEDSAIPNEISDMKAPENSLEEIQGVLDETEADDWDFDLEDKIALGEVDEPVKVDLAETEPLKDDLEEFDFEDELLSALEDEEPETEEALPEVDDLLMGDEELDALESEIQNAVNTLEPDTLDQELEPEDFDTKIDDSFLEELNLPDVDEDESLSGLDDLDMLDERELKLAIGEEVEDELELEEIDLPEVEENETEEESEAALAVEPVEETVAEMTHAEGVEALQALLKALSNEDVAKSLKGLNISININFGNQQ